MLDNTNSRRLCALLVATFSLCGCTYLQYASVQASYKREQADQPSQWIAKHSVDGSTCFIYGRLLNDEWQDASNHSLAIAAFSSRYRRDEIVEINQLGQARTHYGMNLPGGDYRLLVFADVNRNGVFEADEVVGERHLSLSVPADRVLGGLDIGLAVPAVIGAPDGFKPVAVSAARGGQPSLFFPKGTIRALDDPIFSSAMSQLGVYEPAAFIEAAPMMFYALEEDSSHKVPVVFVHGMGGSAKEFEYIVERMDRTRYKPWFFHYPSGGDLAQLAHLFYDIFLSGTVIPANETPTVVVAHSMGGLIAREAMNRYERGSAGNRVDLFISLATPFGGEPSAGVGVKRAPFVPPAWRGLDPGGEFIDQLFRHPLPESTSHHLIYAYRNTRNVARGTDGVIPLSSQLANDARDQATVLSGFKSGHAEILRNPAAIARIIELVGGVKSWFPEDQLRHLIRGGFDVPLGPGYSDVERYMIRTHGRLMRALAAGEVAPIHPIHEQFIGAMRGERTPATPLETAWARFRSDYPQIAAGVDAP